MATTVSEFVNQQRHGAMAQFGATGNGGIRRLALSAEDAAARAALVEWAAERGFTAWADEIGNLYVRRDGRQPDAAAVLTGSHLDSQPAGGNFDGVFGVLAGLEALEALEDAGVETKRPIELVVWTNEEGCRFEPGTMGSATFAGAETLADMLAVRDHDGATVAEAVQQTLALVPRVARRAMSSVQPRAYVEAHIEQGPRLEREGSAIGVVSGVQGARWYRVDIDGREGHAGTVPMSGRRDAFRAAVNIAGAMHRLFDDASDRTRFTIGRCDVSPGAPSTIPGHVTFSIDFRHPERDVLIEKGRQIAAVCRAHASGCDVRVEELMGTPPTRFDADLIDLIETTATRLGLSTLRLMSGADHDARLLAQVCPAAMIFIACKDGLSHNEAEHASLADMANGARVLADVLLALANA